MFKIETPTLRDIPQIQLLLEDEVKSGNILYREDDVVATNIRSYLIVKDGKKIIGSVALHIYSTKLAEFRSMIVDRSYRNRGVGKLLIEEGFKKAQTLGLEQILVLTYRSKFFRHLGFVEIPKIDIPNSKIWADCINCKSFPVCDEVALIKEIKVYSKTDLE